MDHFATLVFVANLRLRVQVANLQHLKAARLASNSRLGANLRHLRAVDWQHTTHTQFTAEQMQYHDGTCYLWLVGSRLWKPEDSEQISIVREKALECAGFWCLKSLEMIKID
jgi:hypothetical protein